jgi:HK97 family phage prohead protease
VKYKTRSFPLEIKSVEDAGHFTGYASVFGVLDSQKEIVLPGAFTASLDRWKSKGRLPPILWQHNSREPVGPHTKMEQDDTGLYIEGQLLVDDIQRAREARALMKAKALGGFSIGFAVVTETFHKDTGVNDLAELDLWESSIVTFPANEAAVIGSVKSALADFKIKLDSGTLPLEKDFEEILREAGFTRARSRCIVNKGYATLLREADSGKPVDAKSIIDEVFPRSTILQELFK